MAPRKVLGSKPPTPQSAIGALLMCALVGCGDPVQDSAIAALGPETPGVERGPLHRPGQPCVLCHSDAGGKQPFLLAGTVYVAADARTPIDGVQVKVVDSLNREFVTATNCAGNFFIRPQDFASDAPLWVSLRRDDVLRVMNTPIYREGSCAGCHFDPQGPTSAGHVYLIDDPTVEKAPVSQCR
jgi:hypothetical protein